MKKIAMIILCAAVIAGFFSGCVRVDSVHQEEAAPTATTSPMQTEATEPTVPAETKPLTALDNDFRIALITLDCIDLHWLDLEAGAVKAAEELGCEVVNLSPMMQDDTQQAEQIAKAVSEGFDAIVVAAEDSDVVTAALEAAVDAGVTVICVDRAAEADVPAVVRTDEITAGRAAAGAMLETLKAREIPEGTIGVIAIGPDDGPSARREAAFREAFQTEAYTLMETRYSEGDAAKAQALAEDCLEQEVVGIFGCDEGSFLGAGNAAEKVGADAVIVGIGKSDAILDLMEKGYVLAAIVDNPDKMGYEGVMAACAVLHGREPDAAFIDTGVSVLTK